MLIKTAHFINYIIQSNFFDHSFINIVICLDIRIFAQANKGKAEIFRIIPKKIF
ncbi:MAG: hypothetical protein Q8885_02410 [Candidatus Phytoplasma stylosanthis]|nr:hypothetical protein [Candidatus Phytoplasma stylosanthis]